MVGYRWESRDVLFKSMEGTIAARAQCIRRVPPEFVVRTLIVRDRGAVDDLQHRLTAIFQIAPEDEDLDFDESVSTNCNCHASRVPSKEKLCILVGVSSQHVLLPDSLSLSDGDPPSPSLKPIVS